MPSETQVDSPPYLSVVVTSRNDDHGGDPLKRLQAFVNTFAAQCRQTKLSAEVVIVEWNPPADRSRLGELLRIPLDAPFDVRVVEVPSEIHQTLRYADVLPLFQMIAKNVGVRRARGRYILATNIDVIFSNELVETLASGQLEPGRLYRVDRHDIDADFPVDARLEEQMAYCQTHQIRVHSRLGTHPVDRSGRETLLEPDVMSSIGFTLGDGWHAREGDSTDGFFRWVIPEARFTIDRTAWPSVVHGAVLDVEFETNPYQPDSWVDLEVLDGERRLACRRMSGRTRLRFPLDDGVSRHEIVMRELDSSGGRRWLPLFQSRGPLCYRIRNVSLRTVHGDDSDIRGPVPLEELRQKLRRSAFARVARRLRQVPMMLTAPLRWARSAAASTEQQRELDRRVAVLAPLADLAPFAELLRDHRPVGLHQNACGDFQLMAREHWFALRGYPELEMFSMSVDGLLEVLANAAGIHEQVFDMPLCIYHLEHEKGSGWSPEGEARLTKRIADSGITWLDASTVHIWAAYMQYLRRPVIFNGPDWGFGDVVLPLRTLQPVANNV